MADRLDEFIEREVRYEGATQISIWRALDHLAGIWERAARRATADKKHELCRLRDRAGSILHFFDHGYGGDFPNAADDRLAALISRLPPR